MAPAKGDEALPPRIRIGEPDLQAYAQGAPDADVRAAVEGHLPGNPDLTAQGMTALCFRGRTAFDVCRVATRVEAIDRTLRTSDHLAARLPAAAA